MKQLVLLLIASLVGLSLPAQVKKAELQATGLTCAMCSNAINKALKKLPNVESVETDLNKNIFTISFKDGSKVDPDELKKQVTGAGFSVGNLWLTIDFDKTDVRNDAHVKVANMNMHFLEVKQQFLQGEQKIRVVDKDFVSSKEYKKYSSRTSMECIKTGYMSSCCNNTSEKGSRIYHVTI